MNSVTTRPDRGPDLYPGRLCMRGMARVSVLVGGTLAAGIVLGPICWRTMRMPPPCALQRPHCRVITAHDLFTDDPKAIHYRGEDDTSAVLDLRRAGFVDAYFPDRAWRIVNVNGGVFYGVDFGNSDLRGADARAADLRGADLSRTVLVGADFTGTTYDRNTRWPDGFDPAAHGARRVE